MNNIDMLNAANNISASNEIVSEFINVLLKLR